MSERVVIKVGGSLLAEPGAITQVADWLAVTARPGQTRVLISGGGAAVDALRRVDSANPLSAAAAHWAAITVMDAGALLLADWLPNFKVQDRVPAEPGDWVLQCGRMLREDEPHAAGERITIGWQTTSDAIAARVAVLSEARLVLLKHTLTRAYGSLSEAQTDGVVDPETPRIGAALRSPTLLGVMSPGLSDASL